MSEASVTSIINNTYWRERPSTTHTGERDHQQHILQRETIKNTYCRERPSTTHTGERDHQQHILERETINNTYWRERPSTTHTAERDHQEHILQRETIKNCTPTLRHNLVSYRCVQPIVFKDQQNSKKAIK